jgi:hypothetical protein
VFFSVCFLILEKARAKSAFLEKARAKSASNVGFCTSRLANFRFWRRALGGIDQARETLQNALRFIQFGLLHGELCRKQNNQTLLFVRVEWQKIVLGGYD